jgi:hypothetical protein
MQQQAPPQFGGFDNSAQIQQSHQPQGEIKRRIVSARRKK